MQNCLLRSKSLFLVLDCRTGEGMYIITNHHLSVFKVNQCNNSPISQSNLITFIFSVSSLSDQTGFCANHANSTQTTFGDKYTHIIASCQIFPATMVTHCASLLESFLLFFFFFFSDQTAQTYRLQRCKIPSKLTRPKGLNFSFRC